ncbi:MAG: RimK family alpha-L-glutamate ligase [Gemmataceae bacterium]
MRLAILASGTGWHVQDLLRATATRRIETEVVDFRSLTAFVTTEEQLPELEKFDAVLVRMMPGGSLEQIVFRMDALEGLRRRGKLIVNAPKAIEASVDKYLTTSRLAAAGIPVPRTWVGEKAEAAMTAFVELGGDVVVKPLFGSEGRGLVRVSDPNIAWRTFSTIERIQGVIYQQEFIRHPGYDLRAFVLGKKVLAGMRRYADGDWRTNVAQGARAETADISRIQEKLAIDAAKAVGCEVAGVDLLPGPNGPVVLEVNGVPGWRALSSACTIDVAGAIIDHMHSLVSR